MTTKTAQFTPGPLHLNGTYLPTGDGIGDGNNAYIRTADGRQLAQMYRKHPQAQAYAPMLAAAPAMYEALREATSYIKIQTHRHEGDNTFQLFINKLETALSQAEGRQA